MNEKWITSPRHLCVWKVHWRSVAFWESLGTLAFSLQLTALSQFLGHRLNAKDVIILPLSHFNWWLRKSTSSRTASFKILPVSMPWTEDRAHLAANTGKQLWISELGFKAKQMALALWQGNTIMAKKKNGDRIEQVTPSHHLKGNSADALSVHSAPFLQKLTSSMNNNKTGSRLK